MKALVLGAAALAAMILATSTASALLIDNAPAPDGPVQFTYHFPYVTSYTHVEPRYAFDDDPLTAFRHVPYIMPIRVRPISERRSMVVPRMSFLPEMYKSTEAF